jgi:hypothetical protein
MGVYAIRYPTKYIVLSLPQISLHVRALEPPTSTCPYSVVSPDHAEDLSRVL